MKSCLKLAMLLPVGWIVWKLTDKMFDWSGLARCIVRRVGSWFPNVKRSRHEGVAQELLVEEDVHLADVCDETMDQNGDVVRRKCRSRMKYVKRVVESIKVKYPMVGLQKTTSDYLTVHHHVVRIMTEHGLVPSHIARLAPIAVGMVFVPSASEVEAQSIVQTLAVEERIADYNATTIDHWLDVWLGYGRRVTYKRA